MTKLHLNQQETERVDQLCAEFDPEQYVPDWMKERADWEAYLRIERHELRSHLEVAVLFRGAFARVDSGASPRLLHPCSTFRPQGVFDTGKTKPAPD